MVSASPPGERDSRQRRRARTAAASARGMDDPSLREVTRTRLDELGLRPNRDLGQNFLVDGRFLDVVGEAAELSRTDVVLEVGGGLGVLSERLAPEVAHLHVVEVDQLLAGALDRSLAAFDNTSLHRDDAVALDFGRLRPPPGKLVANLPYGVATTVLLKALEELADVELLVAMVQREVAERLAATPGSRTYGATSVLAQLSCAVQLHRRVPRSAFLPVPNVDSALVVLRRRRASPTPGVRALIRAAFGHRRKTLAGSLALCEGYDRGVREHAREALLSLGHPADARAERLSPADFVALAELLEAEGRVTGERPQGSIRPPAVARSAR
ncbi:MAG: SSU rRNA (adenine(1518)-N(6)/adenine(1519)-N(6))-dimethyltransferase [uncultured Solirubrobacterales bacterium]|uniref:Ribosomal RNA small subunit methyltransferase A n=1 Tax=uncultured Solirubrobacterales bacterium TaxID=768556 RepID=A0A6J4T6X8_9ACTN|nr:MAG: SSU rRNA (adenine(1518)-N(6)/adenine(1519)-N(6))-dimethyltransferase [uncultured Solirubrobacterales bacterium]